jgi:negative modulator of initiation of replication
MKTINVDEEVYLHIAQNTREIGESASDILRRLLGLEGVNGASPASPVKGQDAHELSAALRDPKFLMQTAAVDKLLYFLTIAYSQKKSEFERVLEIQGRGRRYFARTREEIEKSGNSTQPRNVPGTPYWVMTNSPTPQKQQMLRDALRLLGYSQAAVEAAVGTIK